MNHNTTTLLKLIQFLSTFTMLFFSITSVAQSIAQSPKISNKIDTLPVPNTFITIPAGEFMMGSISGQNNEKLIHQVSIASFQISTTELSLGQFHEFIASTNFQTDAELNRGCYSFATGWNKALNWNNTEFPQSNSSPVVCVSYNDIKQYLKWLNQNSDFNYRLPTEAEWEYAARAGTTTAYSWGDEIPNKQANCADEHCHDEFSTPSLPGSFSPNPFGLYDIHGNVWEWVEGCWNETYSDAPNDGSADFSGDCSKAVVRGGSWLSLPDDLRSAYRANHDRSTQSQLSGFRLVREKK